MKKISVITLALASFVHVSQAQFNMSEGSRKLATTMTLIEKMYVDEVSDTKLAEDAIISLLDKLDPHSTYISADEVREMNEPLEGNFDGIGISFNMITDTLYVVETISGGPSEKVGILPGDRIIEVNDTIIAGVKMTTKDIMKRLRGTKGTEVDIKVLRRGMPELLDFRITRDKIPIYSLDASYMIDNETGYIKLSRFGATTYTEFMDALKQLKSEGMQHLILDLQSNGGGYLNAATEIANEFLGKDKLIVYTEGEHQKRFSETSNNKGSYETGKLVILVNEGSASASEIVSGAVQDWDRGVIVGRRTFGKGLVQRQFPLPDGSMIRLTVARYYTPTGRSIQRPYTAGDKDSYAKEFIDRYNNGEMMSADSIHFPDSLKYNTLIKNRIVYGGGGIMPDYFVPVDTLTSFHIQLLAKGIVHKLYLSEVDNHRQDILTQYPTIESYIKSFNLNESIFDKLQTMAREEDIEFKEEDYLNSKESIGHHLKALIAQNVYDTSAYYKVMNNYNPIFQQGLEIIEDNRRYNQLLNGD